MVDRAFMEVNSEQLGTKEKIIKEMNINQSKFDNVDKCQKGIGEWESQLDILLGGMSDPSKPSSSGKSEPKQSNSLTSNSKEEKIKREAKNKQEKNSKQEKEDKALQDSKKQDLMQELDDLDKEFEELEKMFKK